MNRDTTKVTVIEPVGGHGGMNYYDIGLCNGLGRSGVVVTLYTCDENPPPSVPGVYSVVPAFRGIYGQAATWRRGLRYVRALVGALCRERLSGSRIVHYHLFHVGPIEYFEVALAKLLGYRVVLTAHDVESFKADLTIKSLVNRTYARADAVIAHNRTSAAEVEDKLGVPTEKIHVVPHGSYLDFVGHIPPKDAAKKAIGLQEGDGPVILFFGQIKEVKGLDLLIEAFALICNDFPDAKLVIAGKVWKDSFDKYQEIIAARGIAHAVKTHIRYIPDEEVSAFYSAADVVVLPYRRIYQSGVLLMAMSYGTPVLTSDLPAMREVVEHSINGFTFMNDDIIDLARVLGSILGDESARKHTAVTATTQMESRFNWLTIGSRLSALFARL